MAREIPFDPFAICDLCGSLGAFDFQGDLLCGRCIQEIDKDYDNDSANKDEEDNNEEI